MPKSPKTGREIEDYHVRNGSPFFSKLLRKLAGVSADSFSSVSSEDSEE